MVADHIRYLRSRPEAHPAPIRNVCSTATLTLVVSRSSSK
ncbi:hypothetical protein BZL30_4518 [Mycobacterium kansasii]|uniref:Uncharacterized protein n=1 Tax=Mycobacterium kansasii TaxID=1768 RepID=A0A1V3X415_MYCKA|nr:hypothetical protein BZL30_4518 [Mycobacterium kansasii]